MLDHSNSQTIINKSVEFNLQHAIKEVKNLMDTIVLRNQKNLHSAKKAGDILHQLKKEVGHGNFLPTLEKEGIEPTSASRYMKVAQYWHWVEQWLGENPTLGLVEAVRRIHEQLKKEKGEKEERKTTTKKKLQGAKSGGKEKKTPTPPVEDKEEAEEESPETTTPQTPPKSDDSQILAPMVEKLKARVEQLEAERTELNTRIESLEDQDPKVFFREVKENLLKKKKLSRYAKPLLWLLDEDVQKVLKELKQ